MKKLKLESIAVTSFETCAAEPQERGTVQGRAPGGVKPYPTQLNCGPTNPELDCTYGCSMFTGCPDNCVRLTETIDCAVV
jgi:hypothetical protein